MPKATDSYLPRPPINPVLMKLQELALVQQHDGAEVVLRCPRCGGMAVYHFSSRQTPRSGAYECRGCHWGTEDFLDYLGVTAFQADWRSKLIVKPGELVYDVDVIKDHLARAGCVFRFDGRLIRVEDKGESVVIQELTVDNLPLLVPEYLSLYRRDNRLAGSLKLKPVDLSEKLSRGILSFSGDEFVPVLKDFCDFPLVDESGRVVASRGYDPDTGYWMNIVASNYESFPVSVSRDQADVACSNLQRLFRGVCFAKPCDEMAAISALFTMVLKWKIPTAPLIHVVADKPGSGKSTLTGAIAGLSSQGKPIFLSFPKAEEEMSKTLFSALRSNPRVVVFDNITAPLVPFGDFCTCLTEGRFSTRILGTSKVMEVRNRAIFLSNGNKRLPQEDLIRRTVLVRLDMQPFREAVRDEPLESLFATNREAIVRDVLTVYRGWLMAGAPQFSPFESFDHWNSCCRFPLLWLDRADPLEETSRLLRLAEGRNDHQRVLSLLKKNFGKSSFRVSDIHAWINSEDGGDCLAELRAILKEWEIIERSSVFNARRCGRCLLRLVGCDGELRLVVDPKATPRLFRVEGEK